MQNRFSVLVGLSGCGLLLLGLLAGLLWAASLQQTGAPQTKTTVKTTPKTIVIAGDIACKPGDAKTNFACRQGDTAALIESLKPNAVLTAGDNQYPNGALADYQASYDKTWGKFKNITYPVPGNHEYNTADATGYFDYFGTQAGDRDKGYYSFKVGDWLMVALNSETDISAGSRQITWLKQTLDANKTVCTLAYWHKPRFSTGGHASDPAFDALWRVLYERGVDIVANGHSHAYERFVPQNPDAAYDPAKGITQFVSGMGGGSSQELNKPLPNLAVRQNHAFGVLKLTLYPKAVNYQFVPIPGQQTFSDTGTIPCH